MFGLVEVIAGPDKGRKWSLADGQTLVLGRARSVEGQLRDAAVGRLHCRLAMEGDKVLVTDLGSTTGTQVNDQKISQHELQAGDIIQVGTTRLSFHWSAEDERNTTDEYILPQPPG